MAKQKRINSAKWVEAAKRWQINVQRDGIRKTFVSNKPGRTGQREVNAKADAWLDEGLQVRTATTNSVFPRYLERLQLTTSESNWRPVESRWRTWVTPAIGQKRLENISEQMLQDIVDKAMAAGLSRKTLNSLCCDLRAFFKFARRSGFTTFFPEDLRVPVSARMGERKILQPNDLTILLNEDTTLYKGKRQIDPYIYACRFQVLNWIAPRRVNRFTMGRHQRKKYNHSAYSQYSGRRNQRKKRQCKPHHSSFRHCMEATGGTRNLKKGTIFPISSEQHYYSRWKRYCAANNITQTSVYELRHTFVSIAQALPEAQLKRLVGHSKAMDTYGIYSHSVDGENESTAILLDDTFSRFAK